MNKKNILIFVDVEVGITGVLKALISHHNTLIINRVSLIITQYFTEFTPIVYNLQLTAYQIFE